VTNRAEIAKLRTELGGIIRLDHVGSRIDLSVIAPEGASAAAFLTVRECAQLERLLARAQMPRDLTGEQP